MWVLLVTLGEDGGVYNLVFRSPRAWLCYPRATPPQWAAFRLCIEPHRQDTRSSLTRAHDEQHPRASRGS